MERGAIPCTKFILLNQQVVRRSLVRCCSVRSQLYERNEPKFPWEFFNPFDSNDDYKQIATKASALVNLREFDCVNLASDFINP